MNKCICLVATNQVVLVTEIRDDANFTTTDDGYVLDLPINSTIKVGDFYNLETQEFIITEVMEEAV